MRFIVGTAPLRLFLLLFAVSGFSGLIYESIWSQYLKLFLGHSAYGQSLVLMTYMGGLAFGSWLAARASKDLRRPLLAYAAAEATIGVLALVFHPLFAGVTQSFYDSILPMVGDPRMAQVLKWSAGVLMIGPQSVLLGMTFPLMSAGLMRRSPTKPGSTVAMLYFTNSFGAALGVLASGFWLVGWIGLPGTIRAAGAINIILAATVALLARDESHFFVASASLPTGGERAVDPAPAAGGGLRTARVFLVAAFVTGLASFVYEIGWIRMLGLVLGSTTHSFELMLSAFIIGLALGGLLVRRQLEVSADPLKLAGNVQVIMGLLAVLSLPLYADTFEWMGALLNRLPRTDGGFLGFTLASHMIAAAVMLPTTIAAGMTLPLFTHGLLRIGVGEAAIGRVYAANTLGAIAGVLFAVHVGLPFLGVKLLIGFGALLDVALGLALLALATYIRRDPLRPLLATGVAAGALWALVLAVSELDPARLASGVYRHGVPQLPPDARVEFYRDGKTSSVAVIDLDSQRTIATNGKPDASIQMNASLAPANDEVTMIMAAALPLAYAPKARRIANVGFGSGLTTNTLLADPSLEVVDTIEIERMMIEGASRFGYRVERAFRDPRSQFYIEDAKTFFPLHHATYDVIITEPSNPWVSGVSSLFSTEFYALVSRYLADDGIMAQWVQFYEFNDDLFFSIAKAFEPHFGDFVVFTASGFDGIIVARKQGELGTPDLQRLFAGPLGAELRRVGIRSGTELMIRLIADRRRVMAYAARSAAPANSDYYPYVDLNAPTARFKNQTAELLVHWSLGSNGLPGVAEPLVGR